MRFSRWTIVFWAWLAIVAGCGGNSGKTVTPQGTTVVVAFSGVPSALAVQIGSGNFMPATIQNGTLLFTVPPGTTKYAIAYACQIISGQTPTVAGETIFEATTQDTIEFSPGCNLGILGNIPLGVATGNVNASAVPGATNVEISGVDDIVNSLGSVSGPFNTLMPTGANDVAAVAVDGLSNVLAVRIVRSQVVPGAINGGSAIVIGPGDATTTQSLTVNGLPAGYAIGSVQAKYATANGAAFNLTSLFSSTQYAGVPPSQAAPGDYYSYLATAVMNGQEVRINQTTASGNVASSITLPAPGSSPSPSPAPFPTFTLDYAGFNGMPSVTYSATLNWSSFQSITVMATKNFMAGSTTLTIPNLTSVAGFPLSPPSGVPILWNDSVQGATIPNFAFFPQLATIPSNNSVLMVRGNGEFILP